MLIPAVHPPAADRAEVRTAARDLRLLADVLDSHDVPPPQVTCAYGNALRPDITWRVATDDDGDLIRAALADLDLWWTEHTYPHRGRILAGHDDRLNVSIATETATS